MNVWIKGKWRKPVSTAPFLPMELLIVEEQILRTDGRFRFRLRWDIRRMPSKERYLQPKVGSQQDHRCLRGKCSSWSAGSVEELLMAILRVEAELASCTGIERVDNKLVAAEARKAAHYRAIARGTKKVGPDGRLMKMRGESK